MFCMAHFSRSFVIESLASQMNAAGFCSIRVVQIVEFHRKVRGDKFLSDARRVLYRKRGSQVPREKEGEKEICNSSVASHRWWVEARVGPPKLARIKGASRHPRSISPQIKEEQQPWGHSWWVTRRFLIFFSFLSSAFFSPCLSSFLLASSFPRHRLLGLLALCFLIFSLTCTRGIAMWKLREISRWMRGPWERNDNEKQNSSYSLEIEGEEGGGEWEDAGESKRGRGGCTGAIVCGVNVLGW